MDLRLLQIIAVLAFGISCNAQCLNQTFIDFEGATTGNNPNTTDMNGSLFGVAGTWSITGPTEMLFSTTGSHALPGYVNLCSGGFRSRAGTHCLQCSVPRTSQTLIFNPSTVRGNAASAFAWFFFDITTNTANYFDMLTLSDSTHNIFVNCSLYGDGGSGRKKMRMELVGGNNNDAGVNLTTNTWYGLACQYNVSPLTNTVAVYDVNLNLLGRVDVQSTYVAAPAACWLAVTATDYTAGNTEHIFYDSVLMDFDRAQFPIFPYASPVVQYATNSLVTNGVVTVTR